MPTTHPTVLENILDPSHVPFTHHGTIGRRDWATPVPLRLTSELTEDGFTGGWERNVATSPMLRRNLEKVGFDRANYAERERRCLCLRTC